MTEPTTDFETDSQQAQFLEGFCDFVSSQYESDLLRKKRLKAWDHIQELGLPDRSDEAFQYLRLDQIYNSSFVKADALELKKDDIAPFVLPESKESFLVFANGSFRPELSNISALKETIVIPLNQASRTFTSVLQGMWAKSLKDECDPFASLNNACHHDGLFFYVPPNHSIASHVQFLHFLDIEKDAQTNFWTMPRMHLILGQGSSLNIVETTNCTNFRAKLFDNRVLDIQLEENSSCTFSRYLHEFNGTSFAAIRAHVKKDARFSTVTVADANFSRLSIHVQLTGSGSETSLKGVNMLSGDKEGHVHVTVDHQEPNCTSTQLFKNVLDDASLSSFEGKIWVRQKAQKTQAYQLNNNLILNSNAEANSKPNLEIFADDVKASHGATSGQLDNEQIFYLKSRGISEELAKACLIQGFCQEVVNSIPNKTLKKKAHQLIVDLYGKT